MKLYYTFFLSLFLCCPYATVAKNLNLLTDNKLVTNYITKNINDTALANNTIANLSGQGIDIFWAFSIYAVCLLVLSYILIIYNSNKERERYQLLLEKIEGKKEKEISERQLSMCNYLSNEFKTHLALITDPLKTAVQQDSTKNETALNIDIALKNSKRLLSLVDQFALLKNTETDDDSLTLSAINLNTLCREVFECFVSQAKKRAIKYEISMPKSALNIVGDHGKIEVAVYNVISNAFKCTPSGGSITLILEECQHMATIIISDTGIGMTEDDKAILDKSSLKDPGVYKAGFGIGLFVVRYLVEKNKGYIKCSSTLGKGSTFTMQFRKGYDHFADLPITMINPKLPELVDGLLIEDTTEAVNNAESSFFPEKKAICIVDNNEDVLKYLTKLFSPAYIVYTANNGITGFEIIQNNLPDLVLSDISADGIDGLLLCRKIKENPDLNHIPVIFLTAIISNELHLQGLNEGADDFITKPFDSAILMAKAERLIKSRNDLKKYFLDNITLKENNLKVPEDYKVFLKKCIETVEANIENENFSIKEFSRQMNISHSTLYCKIKLISGQTLSSFIRSIRLRKAALIMLTEDSNIAQAGIKVGFEDQKYFRKQFFKQFGMNPSDYIKKYKASFNKEVKIFKNEGRMPMMAAQ